jgi:hypothetical protein
MPTELQIIRASEFIRLDPQRHFDFQMSKEALRLLAVACRLRGIDRAMLDLRALPIPARRLFTTAELTALIGTFREAGFTPQHRLAVLYQRDPHGGARMFAFIGLMRGWQVRAFSEFEAALVWLSEAREKRRPTLPGRSIPIHFREHRQSIKRPTATGADAK